MILSRPSIRLFPRAVSLSLVVSLLLAGPVACFGPTRVAPVGAEGPAFSLQHDEQRLWKQSEEEERQLRAKASVYQDPILDDYLNQVAQRLVPPEIEQQGVLKIRVSTIKDPALNAFTFPTGSVYVHTGLLARLENEAQLATVLGHEITHATNRHALEFQRSARNKQIGFSIAALVASIAVANAAGNRAERGDISGAYVYNQVGNILVQLGMDLAFLAAVNGFGRELEREADQVGLQRMAAAGYDPRQAPRLFELLKDDHGDDPKMEVFFFGSHPRLDERLGDMQGLVAARYPGAAATGGVADTRDFRMRTRVLVRDDAAQNLDAGRYGHAEEDLKKVLELTPNDPVAHDLSGRLAEKRAVESRDPEEAKRLLAQARASYEEAMRLDATYADPFRSAGILHYKAGEKKEALAAFRRYLALKPDAPDAQQIKDYILELEAR
ncbi:MAG TPA: M48 family metalloprotease [Candidatus Polarisedimenticolia bacterium]|nr:M48 family metalloprotease [Candidatus Polarisedimenticolia bacterium]